MTEICGTCGADFEPSTLSNVLCTKCVHAQLTDREELEQALVAEDNPFGKPDSCRVCPLFRQPGPVPPSGPTGARMLFVGEAPGADEVDEPQHRKVRWVPFIGGSGRLLTACCIHAGIQRKLVRITNAVLCRPPGNRTPTQEEISCCSAFLRKEIEDASPNVVVALGETPLNALTGKSGIGNWRGVPLEGTDGRKVFPTWHPAFIARAQYNWPFAVHDLARAQAESGFPEVRRVPFEIVRDPKPAVDGPDLLRDARARGAATFDFETSGLSPQRDQIVMVGVVARPDQAHVFTWSPATAQLFQTLLDDPQIEIVGQNILFFDLPFAEEKGVDVSKTWPKVFDTMVTFHLANASYGQTPTKEQTSFQRPGQFRQRGMDKDLTMIASCHTDIPYWKSRENYQKDLRGVCGIDCIATDRAALHPVNGLKKELAAYDMLDLYYKHVLPVHPVIHRMTRRGVRIDEDRGAAWSFLLEQKAQELEATLKLGLNAPDLNLDSPPQLMKLLYGDLGLPIQYLMDKKKGMRPTANAEALENLAAQFPQHAVLSTIVGIRNLKKLKSTFVDPHVARGRVHPKFSGSKTSTGRFNSWDPNAQNVPEDMRDIWIPDDDDCVLLAGDWSQIEWRLAMVLSGDPVGLELLASGVDNHKAVASEALGIPFSEVTDAQRHAAKFIVYGLGYGRGAESISVGHNLEIGFVREFIARFFNRFRVFAAWREENLSFVKKHHYLANAFKRRRWWYTYEVTEVYNFPQQSNAADMMYEALIDLDRELPKDATLRLTVHDECVVNVPKATAREALQCMRAVMQRTWPEIVAASRDPQMVKRFYPNGWFCPVDVHVGTNWKMAKSKDAGDKKARAELERYLGIAA
jgi:uracil-DNA glycosylase family 4